MNRFSSLDQEFKYGHAKFEKAIKHPTVEYIS